MASAVKKEQRRFRMGGKNRGILPVICLFLLMLFSSLIVSVKVARAEENKAQAANEDTPADEEDKYAVDPVGMSDRYSAVLYNNTNGLPTSEANDIAQTSEGFIWIGSYSGLIRYDGHTFERVDSTTGIASVVCLHVDEYDRLWIGTNDCGLAMIDRDKTTMWNEEDGLGAAKVTDIDEDENGTIYVGTTAGVCMVNDDLTLTPLEDPLIAGAYIDWIGKGINGTIYCLTNEEDYFCLKDGKLVDYIGHDDITVKGINVLFPDPDHPEKMYIGSEESGLYYGNLKSDADTLIHLNTDPLASVICVRRYGDRIWIAARSGVGILDDQGFHYLENLPMNNSINHIMEDYEGNIWFTSSRQGVMKLVYNQFADVFSRYGLEERVVNSTCIYNDRLFIGADTGLVVLEGDEQLKSLPLKSAKTASGKDAGVTDLLEYLDGIRIRSILPDSKGRLWISTWRYEGLICCDGDSITIYTEEDGLLTNHIRAVTEGEDGSIYVALTGGLNVIKDGKVVKSYDKEDGITNPESLSVTTANNGDIVLGSNGAGIYIINEESVRCIDTKDGLTSGIVMRVKHDTKRDIFWIVTSNSIAYMTPDYKVTTIKDFPYSNNFDMYENSKGDMWILSSNGIYVSSTQQLIENGPQTPVHYGMANGLPCISTSNSYSCLTGSGDLYIAGSSGVTKVNINSSLENVNDLKQAVPYIRADGKLIYPDENGNFILPSNVQKVTVYAYIFNYSLTDPKVSYYLDGFDRGPVTVSRSELGPISYTNLPGGSYKFVMEIKDAMGRGGKTYTVTIIKRKAIYEKIWFYLLVALATILILTILVKSYVSRKVHAMEERHKEEAERERLNNELGMATKIQSSMLPHEFPPFPDRNEFDIYASMTPAKEVGGDFYDFFLVDEDHLCLVMADVSGKGVPAALFMATSKVILQRFAAMGQSPAEILSKANDNLCANNQVDMFVTVWLGILEISTGKLTAANAGHEYPVIRHAGEGFELLKDKHGLVLGGMEGAKYKQYELQLNPGDAIFVYTDGLPEATDSRQKMFGTDRMLQALNLEPDGSPERILNFVTASVKLFVNEAEQFDDLTMLCLAYKGSEKK